MLSWKYVKSIQACLDRETLTGGSNEVTWNLDAQDVPFMFFSFSYLSYHEQNLQTLQQVIIEADVVRGENEEEETMVSPFPIFFSSNP